MDQSGFLHPGTAGRGPGVALRPAGGADVTFGARVVLVLLRAYKLVISPLLPPACRFTPTCSEYAAEAVSRHGVGRGLWLALKRVCRCQPFCAGGHDPVR